MTNSLRLLTLLCAVLFLGGCSEEPKPADADDVKREARELAETLESYSADQKEQAVAEAQRALADLNGRVEDLKARISERWGAMDESARENAQENLDKLEAEQARLADRFAALRDASGDAWARLSEGFSAAYDELRDAWRESEQELAE
ncbi:MAG: hypothetical protein RIC56_04790 [Pseudomonadales bacterium]